MVCGCGFREWLLQEERQVIDAAVLQGYENAFQQELQKLINRTRDPELKQAFEDMRSCPIKDQRGRCHRFIDYILGSLLRWAGHERRFDLEDALQYIVFRMLSRVGERGTRRRSVFDFDETRPYDLRIGNPLQQIFRAYPGNDLRSVLGNKIRRIRTTDRPKGTISIGTDPNTVSPDEIPGRATENDELIQDIMGLLKRKSTPELDLVALFKSILAGTGTRFQRQHFGHDKADLGRKIIVATIHQYAQETENYAILRLLHRIENPEPRQPKPAKALPKPEMPREEKLYRSIVELMEKHGRKVGSAILGKYRRRWVERKDPSGNHPNLLAAVLSDMVAAGMIERHGVHFVPGPNYGRYLPQTVSYAED